MSTASRLARAFADAPVLPLSDDTRYVLFSDCHRGSGGSGDNFLKNQHLYTAALEHYFHQGYTYLELGDGDELWENRRMEQIVEIHSDVFWLLSRFYQEDRLYLLYGNHDIVKRRQKTAKQCFSECFCTESQCHQPLLPGIAFYQGLILRDETDGSELYLTHGHQADPLNSVFWPQARFLVRYLWGPMERLGFLDPTSAAKNNVKKRRTEQRLTDWAKTNHHVLITGHTHRPMLGSAGSPYFNTGSCVHPWGITCLELEKKILTLVKWTMLTRPDMSLYVGREILGEPVPLDSLRG